MKNDSDTIITVASWENRFRKGIERVIEKSIPKIIYTFFYKEYADVSENNRNVIRNLCGKRGVAFYEYELSFKEPVTSWKVIYNNIIGSNLSGKRVIVDISTMPRETIWTIFSLLEEINAKITYLYNKPEGYNDEWLSRDPDRPRIVFKLAGEAKLGAQTLLMILPGFDPDRTEQLIQYFEPRECFIGLQVSHEHHGESNIKKHREKFGEIPGIGFFDIDAYSLDHGFNTLDNKIKPFILKYNIIMASLGPKLSAVALYKLHKKYPETALVYAPSKEFNIEYSYGIGESITGQL